MNKPWPFRPMHGPNCNVLCMLYLVLQLCKNLLEKIIKLLLRLYVVYHNWKKTNNYTINLWRDKDRERERQTETEREREERERETHTHTETVRQTETDTERDREREGERERERGGERDREG